MQPDYSQMANAIRALSMDAVQAANSGHPGMPMGMADVATLLYARYLKFDPAAPKWPDRDRFVLSAGHGSMLAYATLHLAGYAQPTIEDIRRFRQWHSPCAGHPENTELAGVECTTGPLGQGLAMAVGMAIAERHLNAVYGDDLVDHKTWVIAGDGCLMEGVNHEAAGLAGHLQLGRLIVLWDDNRITIDGSTALSTSEDIAARYAAYGWHVAQCDGHDFADIARALDEAMADPRPSLIACRTIIGKGAPNKQGSSATHGSPLGAEEVAAARAALGWDHAPFVIPDDVRSAWLACGDAGRDAHAAWARRLAQSPHKPAFEARMAGNFGDPADLLSGHVARLFADRPSLASRKASEAALEVLTAAMPALIGGSADLTGSNNTKTAATVAFTPQQRDGRYLYYGIREFGMAAAMNGMALHGGIIPYGGTFLVFSDYCRNAIRLSALQKQRVIYVMTHDSIGLGEDGPTHQPVEHLMSLRAMPGLRVFRPADAVETAECWALALAHDAGPSLLALSRQNLPTLRAEGGMLSARGAYRLRAAQAPRQVVLLATGSEVSLACDVATVLEAEGIGADVISMPCWEIFDLQDAGYQNDLIDKNSLLVSIEAGVTLGWQKYVGADGLTIGLDHFGASAPAETLFQKFGFETSQIISHIKSKIL